MKNFIVISAGLICGVVAALLINIGLDRLVESIMSTEMWCDKEMEECRNRFSLLSTLVKLPIAGYGLFWTYAYSTDLVEQAYIDRGENTGIRQKASLSKLTKDSKVVFWWCFFGAIFLYNTANIAGTVAKETLVREIDRFKFAREIHVVNYETNPEDIYSGETFTKLSWHFFFEEGNLTDEPFPDAPSACVPDNIDTENYPSGTDFRNILPVGYVSQNRRLEINNVVKARFKEIIETVYQCQANFTEVNNDRQMLTLLVSSSRREWRLCTDSENKTLNSKLSSLRVKTVKDIFDEAKAELLVAIPQSNSPKLKAIEDLVFNVELGEGYLDFSDSAFSEAYYKNLPKDKNSRPDLPADPTPFFLSQSASLILENPRSCGLSATPQERR